MQLQTSELPTIVDAAVVYLSVQVLFSLLVDRISSVLVCFLSASA